MYNAVQEQGKLNKTNIIADKKGFTEKVENMKNKF